MAFTKHFLSGSTNGRQIKIVATGTPGTLIHTAHLTALDELWLWAVNSESTARKLTIEWGEATAPDGHIEVTIPAESGYLLVVPGMILTSELVVNAFAASANAVLINGYVNRIIA